MKTLIVKYTPREERSSSKKLLDAFRNEIKNSDGKYFGLLKEKKVLIIISSGVFYTNESMVNWEHAMSLSKIEFHFMGFSDIRGILAEGMNAGDEIQSTNLPKSIDEIKKITQDWYGK